MELAGFSLLNWRSIALLMPLICTFMLLLNALRSGSERASLLWLLALSAAAGISATPMIIGFAGAYDLWPNLTFLPTDFSLLLGPLLLAHAQTLMLKKPYSHTFLIWLIPGAIHFVYQFFTFTQFADYESKWQYSAQWHEPYVARLLIFLAAILSFAALTKIQTLRKNYLQWLENHRANERQYETAWFAHLYFIAPPLLLVWLASNMAFSFLHISYEIAFWADLTSLLGLFLLVAEATSHSHKPYPKQELSESNSKLPLQTSDTKNWEEEGLALLQQISNERWFLDPELTLQDVSRMAGSNQSYVSKALNTGLNRSFSSIVNELRVEYAKQLIAEEQLSLLEIAGAAGFGSKSSFNRAFSQFCGKSPSSFKTSIKKSQILKVEKYT